MTIVRVVDLFILHYLMGEVAELVFTFLLTGWVLCRLQKDRMWEGGWKRERERMNVREMKASVIVIY